MKCRCGTECVEQKGNLAWTSRDGIQVTLTGSSFHACPVCHTAILPQSVKSWLEKAVDRKREVGGKPYLFLNAAAFPHS